MGSSELFRGVPGQDAAVATLLQAAARPVHAYLLLGPAGSGTRPAARAFAAALLCRQGGCGSCSDCRRALAAHHPDLTIGSHEGARWMVEEIRALNQVALRRPLEGARTVVVIPDADQLTQAAPALLKTLEEPPSTTVLVLIAEDLPRSLETIRSRCVEVRFDALRDDQVAAILVADGIEPVRAAEIAEAAAGDVSRARLLIDDPDFAARMALWRSVPGRLDGSGASAAALTAAVEAAMERAAAPLVALHEEELADFDAQAKELGLRAGGRRELIDHHRREIKAFREGDLRAGLGLLSRCYRSELAEALVAGDDLAAGRSMAAIDAIGRFVEGMSRARFTASMDHLMLELS